MARTNGELVQKGGHPGFMRSNLKRPGEHHLGPSALCHLSQTDVEELTRVELLGRQKMLLTLDFFKKNIPGFENSFIVFPARSLAHGAPAAFTVITWLLPKTCSINEPFEDTIAIFPDLDRGETSRSIPILSSPTGLCCPVVSRTCWWPAGLSPPTRRSTISST